MPHLVAVYIGEDRTIVAPNHQIPGGVYYEQDTVFVLRGNSTAELGAAIAKAWEMYSVRQQSLYDRRMKDWAALRESGCRSQKRFLATFHYVRVHAINEIGSMARASVRIPGDQEFEVGADFYPQQGGDYVGNIILGVVERALKLRRDMAPASSVIAAQPTDGALQYPEPNDRSNEEN